MDGNLGKDNQVRSIFLRLFDRAEDTSDIAFAIAIGRIDLSYSDAHLKLILTSMRA